MKNLSKLEQEYEAIWNKLQLEVSDSDYERFEQQRPILDVLANIKNSALTVFDLNKKIHIYSSYNFINLLGHPANQIIDTAFFDSKIHPEDHFQLMEKGVQAFQFYFELPKEERRNYKYITEYRILNKSGKYVKIIEQHIPYQFDKNGHIWLDLSVIDLAPNQNRPNECSHLFVNTTTGKSYEIIDLTNPLDENLTKREKEIIFLLSKGLLSKEISADLNISIHTVNNHRQNILRKLNANNTVEALSIASRFGVVG